MEPNEEINSGKFRAAMQSSSPYASWGSLVTCIALVVSTLTGQLPTTSAKVDERVHEQHSEQLRQASARIDRHDVRLATQESATAELYRAVDRQDRNIEAMQQRTDAQLQALNGKMDEILRLMIQDSRIRGAP